jgi:hypothetical protein
MIKKVSGIIFSTIIALMWLVTFPGLLLSAAGDEPEMVSTEQYAAEAVGFYGKEIETHVAAVKSLDPPSPIVLGAPTQGQFTWGSLMRAITECTALSGQRTIAGRDVVELQGKLGLIEAKQGGKTFAQLGAALTLRQFGTDLKTNALWQSLTPEEQKQWRSLLDPGRFYDRKTRHVISLPENYFGVAARIVTMDYQMGLETDKAFVDDILNRAADPFLKGALYADDNLPTGRYDRYSQEYARYVYEAAGNIGRKDIQEAVAPSLKKVMQTWWGLVGTDGCGYPWGRTIGVISYMDTMEIVGFLAEHPEYRPAPLPELAAVHRAAFHWLVNDYQADKHLLNMFGFGRGNYSYMTPERQWQQTSAFLGKAASSFAQLNAALKAENVKSFPAKPRLPDVSRFDFFRNGDRPAGAWLVRRGQLRFALPFSTGTASGVADYLPSPHGLPGFAAPVEQFVPAMTPYLELDDGRTIVAGDCADEIHPAADGQSVRAIWKRWEIVKNKMPTGGAEKLVPGKDIHVDTGLTTEVTWQIDGQTLTRTERITALRPTVIKHFQMMFTSTGNQVSTRFEDGRRTDRFNSPDGSVEVTVLEAGFPLKETLEATGDSAIGKGTRCPIPLILDIQAADLSLKPGDSLNWSVQLRELSE